jgi:SAM-dependent methyltransferase
MFLQDNVARDARVLDFGAYRSEILPVLHRMGFTDLHGIDLNVAVSRQLYRDRISYAVADFYHAPFADASCAAITSISAIEHGLDIPRLFKEVSRVLCAGGYFLCSTDYWPAKVATSSVKIFGMSWTIFSEEELRGVIDVARANGLWPVGPLCFSAATPVVHHAGNDYTFAWFALRKR